MKNAAILVFAASCLVGPALASPSVSDVVVRQQWPWRGQVRVDFLLDGIGSSDVKFTFTAYDGVASLGPIPDAAVVGDLYADQNGLKTVAIDPAYAPALRNLGTVDSFRLEVSCSEIGGRLLYKVIDLTKTRGEENHVRYVSDADLQAVGSTWGLYQVNPVPGQTSVVWVQPAQNASEYKKKYLVMRRVRPGSFGLGASAISTTITRGYWIGIFELTAAQYDHVAATPLGNTADYPQRNVSQNMMRGTAYSWPGDGHRVEATSFLGRLCAKVGEPGFDLPTEAQWEYACRAGTTDNTGYRSDATLGDICWYNGNSGSVAHASGGKLPNAWGLYDMIGNVWEHTLVWAGTQTGGYDPAGPATVPSSGQRLIRGGCFRSGEGNSSCVSRTSDTTSVPGGTSDQNGFRLVQNGVW